MLCKTSELNDVYLDWAVAKCEDMAIEIRSAGACGRPLYVLAAEQGYTPWIWKPSTGWPQGGPIIEREEIAVWPDQEGGWWARITADEDYTGPTPLVAAMRCYVASKLGEEVEVPDELITQ